MFSSPSQFLSVYATRRKHAVMSAYTDRFFFGRRFVGVSNEKERCSIFGIYSSRDSLFFQSELAIVGQERERCNDVGFHSFHDRLYFFKSSQVIASNEKEREKVQNCLFFCSKVTVLNHQTALQSQHLKPSIQETILSNIKTNRNVYQHNKKSTTIQFLQSIAITLVAIVATVSAAPHPAPNEKTVRRAMPALAGMSALYLTCHSTQQSMYLC